MRLPHFVGAPLATADNTVLRLTWSEGDLPREYYEEARVDEGSSVVATSPLNARAMSITLAGTPPTHAGKTDTFTLLFPDRRRFTECWHAGSDDTYRVSIAVTFADDAKSTTATFEGSIDLGPL